MSAVLSPLIAVSGDFGDRCGSSNPVCMCTAEKMVDGCPAMRAEHHPFVLLLPSAPLNSFSGAEDEMQEAIVLPAGGSLAGSLSVDYGRMICRDLHPPAYPEEDLNIRYNLLLI